MCDLQVLSREEFAGVLISLCENAVEHVAEYTGSTDSEAPIWRVLESFVSIAKTIVVEYSYFDLDYRSEVAHLQELSFSWRNPETERYHFFELPVPKGLTPLWSYVSGAAESYLGYMVVRPQDVGTVGRTMISPRANAVAGVAPEDLAKGVRTLSTEDVQLFGVPLKVTGIPFMEQDAGFLSCAHISAWICHYTAVLQGLVVRRSTAMFHDSARLSDSIGRPYPSDGLAVAELSHVLREFDLPAELHDCVSLGRVRRQPHWGDQQETKAALRNWEKLKKIPKDVFGEYLVSEICRYLNSTRPLILGRDGLGHTQVIVGYLRERDVKPLDDTSPLYANDVFTFIVSDDQRGPFVLVRREDLVDEMYSGADTFILAPLPRAVWMSGGDAELFGVEAISSYAVERRGDPDQEKLGIFAEAISGDDQDDSPSLYSARTYLASGSEFKQSWTDRVEDDSLNLVVNLVPLPRFVWVVEAQNRELRLKNQACVVATAVFDATAMIRRDQSNVGAEPLMVHIPGYAYISALAAAASDQADDEENEDPDPESGWIGALDEPYPSGRREVSNTRTDPGQFKRAVPGR